MTLGTRLFWTFVAALLGASAYFATHVEAERAAGLAAAEAKQAAESAP